MREFIESIGSVVIILLSVVFMLGALAVGGMLGDFIRWLRGKEK